MTADKNIFNKLTENIESVMIGKSEVIELMMIAILCEGHVLLEDVPGTGKTTLASCIAKTLGCSFTRFQFTPDLLPSDITGINFYNMKQSDFEFRPGPIFHQLVLADEINRATPRTQSALLQAMQERQVSIDGTTYPLQRPFFIIATQNPIELEGTFPLPEAQLDRFFMRLKMGYPTPEEEANILDTIAAKNPIENLKTVVSNDQILALQEERKAVHVSGEIRDYIVKIVHATRNNRDVHLGASPRASIALFEASQACALIHGRTFVIPDDVKYVAKHVLNHRIILSGEALLKGRSLEDLIEDIIDTIPVPVEG